MLTRRDAENIFGRVSDRGVSWEFWHDNGNYNIWVGSDGDWLVQVGHRESVIVLTHNDPDDDEQVGVLAHYNDDCTGVKMLAAATEDPYRTHANLRDHPATEVVAAEITIK